MRKTVSIIATVIVLLLAFSSSAEETTVTEDDWFYPFGISDNSTYDEVITTLLQLYPTNEKRIVQKEEMTIIYPENCTLFDVPLTGIVVKRFGDNGFAYILLKLEDNYNEYGGVHYLDALLFLLNNCKTGLLNVEPSTVTYDLNGNPITKSFLNNLDSFGLDFLDKDKSLDYTVSWHEALINLTKDNTTYSISIMFYSRAYAQQE